MKDEYIDLAKELIESEWEITGGKNLPEALVLLEMAINEIENLRSKKKEPTKLKLVKSQ